MKAIRIDKVGSETTVSYVDFDEKELMDGDVTVRVSHSSVNYKDGLAVSGKAPVVRRFPMIPGIDFVGRVEDSSDRRFKPGDQVVLTGWGAGETHLGGYAEKARVPGAWLVPLPPQLTPRHAMALGTAGLTAMLALMAIEDRGLSPADGPMIVTGAAGGVGSLAVMLCAGAGWTVIASTGRVGEADYLKALGAHDIIARDELAKPGRPLAKEQWAAGIDVVGSQTLANLLAQTRYCGAIAACGLTQGMDLPTSVAPFILRGVSLLGIDSVMCPQERRLKAWSRLGSDVNAQRLDDMTQSIPFERVMGFAPGILAGQVRGRVVVDIG